MAGIPIHTSSPISPTTAIKPFGISPSTSAARYTPLDSVTSPTTSSTHSSPPQPGAAAMPRPTNALAAAQNNIPSLTPTRPFPPSDGPLPPEPGAAPHPQNLPYHNHRRHISSPVPSRSASLSNPKPNHNTNPYAPPPLLAHQQPSVHLSTPTRSIPPASTTSTPHDLSHPPGYVQNARDSFEDRACANNESDTSMGSTGLSSPFASLAGMTNRRSWSGTGILNGEIFQNPSGGGHSRSGSGVGKLGNGNGTGEERSVWDTAVEWARATGKKLSETEEEVWRWVNGKG